MRVVIVGGGIGGLAAGLALRRVGFEVMVLEQAPRLEAVGAGIGLAANAMQALDRIGVGDAVRARGLATERLVACRPNGKPLADLTLNGREMLGVHRADLQEVMAAELGDALRLGATYVAFRDSGSAVTAALDGGEQLEGDVLVGADGIRSRTRQQLLGDVPPAYAGYTGWRAVTDLESDSLQGRMTETWGAAFASG